jgi:hypothetical protein
MVRYLVELDMPYDRRKESRMTGRRMIIFVEGCFGSKPWQKQIIIFGDAQEVCVGLVGWWRRRRRVVVVVVVKTSFEKLRRGVCGGRRSGEDM